MNDEIVILIIWIYVYLDVFLSILSNLLRPRHTIFNRSHVFRPELINLMDGRGLTSSLMTFIL